MEQRRRQRHGQSVSRLAVELVALLSTVAYVVGLRRRLRRSREEVELLTTERRSERQGRIRAEKKLRDSVVGGTEAAETTSTMATSTSGLVTYPLKPIGKIRSCFSQRNGTPRQPLLVTSARCTLTLRSELSSEFLEGLEQFSHAWILFVFHENTDIQKVWSDFEGVRGKIRVPRLNGAKLGVLATRSPHRPCPIGLSVAEVVAVDLKHKKVTFGGADIVDGSPVLDIKPYVPFCDSVQGSTAPHWVDRKIDNDPLQSMTVHFTEEATAQIASCFARTKAPRLFDTPGEFMLFVKDALSRDIRSVTQRIKIPERDERGRLHAGEWHAVFNGLDMAYDITSENTIVVCSCAVKPS
jgi:tRNA-Thr(GGU) m(6)t(6)A37 methyltransferase TsaA